MAPPPPCKSLGPQCRELHLTLRIAELDEDNAVFHDAVATWLMGHTERITFGRPYIENRRLLVDATVHVGCKYLETEEGDRGRQREICAAHGFSGSVPPAKRRSRPNLRPEPDRYTIIQDRKLQTVSLMLAQEPRRALPILQQTNPCAGAPCRTADHVSGAACCRDLTAEVVMLENAGETEAFLRSRVSPYLCKVRLAGEDILECEIISACGHLGADRISCALHGMTRPDGAPAKPSICSEWPDIDPDSTYHPGCRLVPSVR